MQVVAWQPERFSFGAGSLSLRASQGALVVKNLPMQETGGTWVRPLGREDPLERGMATHSTIFAWRVPSDWEVGGLQSIGSQRVRHNWRDLAPTHTVSLQERRRVASSLAFGALEHRMLTTGHSKPSPLKATSAFLLLSAGFCLRGQSPLG